MTREEQEAALTLWANGVADELESKDRPELAVVFQGLARRDATSIREAITLYSPGMLEGLRDMVELEKSERQAAGEGRTAEILDWLLGLVREATERSGVDTVVLDDGGPIQ